MSKIRVKYLMQKPNSDRIAHERKHVFKLNRRKSQHDFSLKYVKNNSENFKRKTEFRLNRTR